MTLFRLLALGLALLLPLRAQNADPTDTAPGVGVAPAPGAAATPPPPTDTAPPANPAVPPAGPNLLPNGDFQADSKGKGWPDGWGKGSGITWETEDGRHFLRLVSQKPGQMLMAYRELPLDPAVKGVEISIRYRTAGIKKGSALWFDARAIFHFNDAENKPMHPDPKPIVFSSWAASWDTKTVRFLVPEGAAKLVLMPSLFQVNAGTLDLAEVRVSALDDAGVKALTDEIAAQEKKKADQAAAIAADAALPPLTPEVKVAGNRLVAAADGKPVWLQGVNVVSLEFNPLGENVLWSVHVALADWNANAIRLPVLDNFWFGYGKNGEQVDREAYRKLVDTAARMAAGKGAYVILDLHRFLAPADTAVDFWKDAAARYKNNPAVLFDLFNEPHDIPWDVWRNGGMVPVKDKEPFHSPGMQALVDAVRGTGARNVVIAGGLAYSYDLTGVLNGYALEDKEGNGIMYSVHFYNWHKGWADHFLAAADKYPLFVGEVGADVKKMNFIPASQQEAPATWVPDALGLIQKYRLNWTAFSLHPAATPVLISDWNYTPTPFWGVPAKDALHGKAFELGKMR